MKRIKKYQGLRGIAIISVVISHIFYTYNYAGAFGVSVFLALSGYLTVYNSMSEKETRYDWKWYIRKVVKFYPLYLAVTLITSTYFNSRMVYGVDGKTNRIAFLMNIFMIQTYSSNPVYWGAFSQVGWYIPVVILSIVITPIFMRFIKRIDSFFAFILLMIILYLEFFVCIFEIKYGAASMKWIIYLFPPSRMLDFGAGGCIAIIIRDQLNSKKRMFFANISLIMELVFQKMI